MARQPANPPGIKAVHSPKAIGRIALIVERPFQVGDRLHITAATGVEIGADDTRTLRYTVLMTGDNRRMVVPDAACPQAGHNDQDPVSF